MGQNTGIIGMNKIPDRPNMFSEFLRKRQGVADQTAAALAKGDVETFKVTGLTSGFINGPRAFRGQNAGIRRQKVGVAHGTLPVVRWT